MTDLERAFNAFLAVYPQYINPTIEFIRNTFFPSWDTIGPYLDGTGAFPTPSFLPYQHAHSLGTNVQANTHSSHIPSQNSMKVMQLAEQMTFEYFGADPDEYCLINTPGASWALLLLSFFFQAKDGVLLISKNNHNSINGMKEIFESKGAVVDWIELNESYHIDVEHLRERLAEYAHYSGYKLICLPAKDNALGTKLDLAIIEECQKAGFMVCLDAAAYLTNHQIDMSTCKPDFLPFSFYKIFGYPTGVGGLFVKKTAMTALQRLGYSGGAVNFINLQDSVTVLAPGVTAFDIGTPNFQAAPAMIHGLNFRNNLPDFLPRVYALMDWLRKKLETDLGERIQIYSPAETDTVTFALLDFSGNYIDVDVIERAATAKGLCIRGGCFCNPGTEEHITMRQPGAMSVAHRNLDEPDSMTMTLARELIGGKFGSIRVSGHPFMNFEDVYQVYEFCKNFLSTYQPSLA